MNLVARGDDGGDFTKVVAQSRVWCSDKVFYSVFYYVPNA